jgi:hypothetical protein
MLSHRKFKLYLARCLIFDGTNLFLQWYVAMIHTYIGGNNDGVDLGEANNTWRM